ncbi:sensor histidine kinase [Butyrivibrio sp. JL13D10]|uniref:sensor histidine kinase n=1 Tax=Butyrivibrio sp. JL13D10 TaxID=3236815 RepID=UPI0038B6B10E
MTNDKRNNKKQSYNEPSLTVEDLSKALYESNNKLSKLITEQNEFFSNISHDLRSPIAAIRSAIEYLQSSPDIDAKKQEELYTLISSKTLSLENMINEIFVLTKLSTKDDLLKPSIVPCGNYLEDFFFMTELNPRYENMQLILDVPLDFAWNIEIDIGYMNRALDNLFENAWRHTFGEGRISLGASLSADEKHVIITVTDNGEGIEENDLPRIFERSYMSDASRNPGNAQGAGLGLSICKKIIELLGGSIDCKSKTGSNHGTTFTITLPIATF